LLCRRDARSAANEERDGQMARMRPVLVAVKEREAERRRACENDRRDQGSNLGDLAHGNWSCRRRADRQRYFWRQLSIRAAAVRLADTYR